jgi:hypothetical protein
MKVFLLVLCLIPVALLAQTEGSDGLTNNSDLSGGGMFRSYDNRAKGIQGHPLMFDQFVPGRIFMSTGKVIDQPLVNVDIHTGELIVKREGREVQVMKGMVKKFSLLNVEDSVHLVKIPVIGNGQYYEPIISGKASLYKRTVKKIREANNTGAYSSGTTYSEFEPETFYYWRKGDELPVAIDSKKTFIPEINAAFGVDLSEFIKKAKVNLKKTEDLHKVFNYLNSRL